MAFSCFFPHLLVHFFQELASEVQVPTVIEGRFWCQSSGEGNSFQEGAAAKDLGKL